MCWTAKVIQVHVINARSSSLQAAKVEKPLWAVVEIYKLSVACLITHVKLHYVAGKLKSCLRVSKHMLC